MFTLPPMGKLKETACVPLPPASLLGNEVSELRVVSMVHYSAPLPASIFANASICAT